MHRSAVRRFVVQDSLASWVVPDYGTQGRSGLAGTLKLDDSVGVFAKRLAAQAMAFIGIGPADDW